MTLMAIMVILGMAIMVILDDMILIEMMVIDINMRLYRPDGKVS